MMKEHIGRRAFIRTSAGLLGGAVLPGVFHVELPLYAERRYKFRAYRPGKTAAPVQCITPDDGFYLHTFYNKCPWSHDGRYFAVTRLPAQKAKAAWGDTAEVCVIDLERQSIRTVYRTKAWGFQLGANIQWRYDSNRYLYTNDIIEGKVVCVRIDIRDHTATVYAGAKYDLAPDNRSVISPQLMNMNMTQYGYSVPDPPSGRPAPFTKADMQREGLWKTDLDANREFLFVSFSDFIARSENDYPFYSNAVLYLFHSQFNRQNTRILQVLRAQVDNKGRNACLFSLNADGTGLQQCLSMEKWNQKAPGGSGNHPNWHPDGEHVVMNCVPTWLGYKDMRFCQFKYDGTDFSILSEKHMGSGHPSIDNTGRYLLADAYPKQTYVVSTDGGIPIRLIDLRHDEEQILCTIANDVGGKGAQYTKENRAQGGSGYKLDPHPVWSPDGKSIAFNGAPEGRRQVYIADLKQVIS
ncbi:hypothetical protein CCY01nite_38430 [Chitinophaga cymbidii]|uniref:Uncharacterized protein n=2 Tax=Chitinophaga cymbidii TaxID=1096750 RepID=A0A512RPF8_9BACT|nr:hypothetical protein CCY01nite_38430 [Chitinophaga cymbidii]